MKLRCFAGIPLNAVHRSALSAVRSTVSARDPLWGGEKWVAESNLHVTLAFYGTVDSERVPELAEGLARAASAHEPLTLPFNGLTAVPSSRTRMIWAAFADADGTCASLARACREAGAQEIADASRPFVPHVTLCRARRPSRPPSDALERAAALLDDTGFRSVSVLSVTLFSSRLTPRGPVYEVLGDWPLGPRMT